MNKDMIIYEVNNIDLYDLNSNQLRELKNEIINNVNISKLEEKINQVILKLSGVGEPFLNKSFDRTILLFISSIILIQGILIPSLS